MAIADSEYIGVSELAAAVGAALSEIAEADRRMKSGATEIPSERTIRFYLEKGLLPKPSKRLGQTLVFGRVHLLQLLVIKKLQADGVPLSVIPDVLKKKGKTETQLEELLGGSDDPDRSDEEASFLEEADTTLRSVASQIADASPTSFASEGYEGSEVPNQRRRVSRFSVEPPKTRHAEPVQPTELPIAQTTPPASETKSFLRSLLSRSTRSASPQRTGEESELEIQFSLMTAQEPERWTRHEVADGLEINISERYKPPADEQGKKKLLETLRKILFERGAGSGKR